MRDADHNTNKAGCYKITVRIFDSIKLSLQYDRIERYHHRESGFILVIFYLVSLIVCSSLFEDSFVYLLDSEAPVVCC